MTLDNGFIREPRRLKAAMNLYRVNGWDVPEEYVKYHEQAAHLDLMLRRSWSVRSVERVKDSWPDSMTVLEVVVTVDQHFDPITLRWHESGAWFRKLSHGGSVREYEVLPETVSSLCAER